MSAFMLINTVPPLARKKYSSNYASSRASRHSTTALSRTASRLSRTDSNTAHSQTGSTSRIPSGRSTFGATLGELSAALAHKKVFDINTSLYVEYKETTSLFERKLIEYAAAVEGARAATVPLVLFTAPSAAVRASTGALLLTADNVTLLRHNYFQELEPRAAEIERQLAVAPPAYAQIIARDEGVDAAVGDEKVSAQIARTKLRAMERRLALAPAQHTGTCLCVRDAVLLEPFWTDVYHDIKYESHLVNYHRWLPPVRVTQAFFAELLDFALYGLRSVRCHVLAAEREVLNADERHELRQNCSFYYPHTSSALLQALRVALLDSVLANVDSVGATALRHQRELLELLVACVCDNLRLQFLRYLGADEVVTLFSDFLSNLLEFLFELDAVHAPQSQLAPPVVQRRRSVALTSDSSCNSVFDRADAAYTDAAADDRCILPILEHYDGAAHETTRKRGFLSRFRRSGARGM